MTWRETASIIIRVHREGVALNAKAAGKLGWKADRPPSAELLDIMKKHKADILALIRPPSRISITVGAARSMLRRVRALGFEVSVSDGGLSISDATGRRRDLSRRLSIAEVYTIVAGLAEDPDLLDLDMATAGRDLSDLHSLEPDLSEPDLSEPGSHGLNDDLERLDSEGGD
jgi:hypothetical protein